MNRRLPVVCFLREVMLEDVRTSIWFDREFILLWSLIEYVKIQFLSNPAIHYVLILYIYLTCLDQKILLECEVPTFILMREFGALSFFVQKWRLPLGLWWAISGIPAVSNNQTLVLTAPAHPHSHGSTVIPSLKFNWLEIVLVNWSSWIEVLRLLTLVW